MTPPGILHLTTFLQGGAGRAITDLACAQHAAGHRVAVVTSATPRGEFGNYREYTQRLEAAGVTVLAFDSLFTRDLALNSRVAGEVSRAIRWQVDVVHAHAAVPAFVGLLYAARAARDVPVVQTQHGWGTNKTPAQAAFDVEMLRRVDAVIATSAATRDLLVRYGAPAAAIGTIPCGLPQQDDGEPPPEARHAIEPFRRRGMAVVACIGSVTANKNQQLVLQALQRRGGSSLDMEEGDTVAAHLRCGTAHAAAPSDAGAHVGDPGPAGAFTGRSRAVPPVAAVVIGEGGEALSCAARDAGLGDRVLACGYQPHAARWLPLVDALVVPSRTEGQGLVVLEAFRAGVPVIASRIPALAELIEDGRTGFLFDEGNGCALAEALARVLALDHGARRAVTDAARARFLDGFTLERMVARHEALYRRLRGGQGGKDTGRAISAAPAAGVVLC